MAVSPTDMSSQTVGALAASLAGATAVFRRHKIDFCCGGAVSLGEAAQKRGVSLDVLVQDLSALEGVAPDAPDETVALIKHILLRYHETHRRELPELIRLARKVEAVHRDNPAVPSGLADVLEETLASLTSHMMKEEAVLFPLMQNGHVPPGPIGVMRAEHDGEAGHIRSLQELTHGYEVPDGACNTWRALYTGVEKFVTDLTEHIHLENNVLFPRFE